MGALTFTTAESEILLPLTYAGDDFHLEQLLVGIGNQKAHPRWLPTLYAQTRHMLNVCFS